MTSEHSLQGGQAELEDFQAGEAGVSKDTGDQGCSISQVPGGSQRPNKYL